MTPLYAAATDGTDTATDVSGAAVTAVSTDTAIAISGTSDSTLETATLLASISQQAKSPPSSPDPGPAVEAAASAARDAVMIATGGITDTVPPVASAADGIWALTAATAAAVAGKPIPLPLSVIEQVTITPSVRIVSLCDVWCSCENYGRR